MSRARFSGVCYLEATVKYLGEHKAFSSMQWQLLAFESIALFGSSISS